MGPPTFLNQIEKNFGIGLMKKVRLLGFYLIRVLRTYPPHHYQLHYRHHHYHILHDHDHVDHLMTSPSLTIMVSGSVMNWGLAITTVSSGWPNNGPNQHHWHSHYNQHYQKDKPKINQDTK